MKKINSLYEKIVLPNSPDKLRTKDLRDFTFRINETQVNNNKVSENDERKELPAFLTQTKSDTFYEQYIIYPMYEKRINKESTALYQQKKVKDIAIESRRKTLDLQCFPYLHPYVRPTASPFKQV